MGSFLNGSEEQRWIEMTQNQNQRPAFVLALQSYWVCYLVNKVVSYLEGLLYSMFCKLVCYRCSRAVS